jgi:hypothetical protein
LPGPNPNRESVDAPTLEFIDNLGSTSQARKRTEEVGRPMLEQFGVAKKTPQQSAAFARDPAPWPDPETLENETALCWEEDLDASVLRLAHTWRRRHAQIVEAVTGNGHVAARDTQSGKTARHSIRPPLGEPLVVAE